jgi:hypothetical protein
MVARALDGTWVDLGLYVGAGEGNRTLMTSLEGWGSAIELRPRARWELHAQYQVSTDSVPVRWHRRRSKLPGQASAGAASTHRGSRGTAGAGVWDGRLRSVPRDVAQLG